jgi:hypothetical protein
MENEDFLDCIDGIIQEALQGTAPEEFDPKILIERRQPSKENLVG